MGDGKVNARKLVIKEGMTPQDVKNNPKATPQQKAFACVFDSDGVEGYSAREAAVFNSTTITDNGEKGITLWTQYQDGTKKGTTVSGDVASFKYAPKEDVKPFVQKVIVKKPVSSSAESITTKNAPRFSEELYKNFKDWSLETRVLGKYVVGHDAEGCLVKDYYFSSDKLYTRTRTKNGQEVEYRKYNDDGTKDEIRYVQNDGTKVEESYFSGNRLYYTKKTKNGQEVEYRKYNRDGTKDEIRYIQNDGTKVEELYFSGNRLYYTKKTKNGQEIEFRRYNADGSLSAKRP